MALQATSSVSYIYFFVCLLAEKVKEKKNKTFLYPWVYEIDNGHMSKLQQFIFIKNILYGSVTY